jgi:outer membrane protein assembly factor BamA
VLLVWSCVLAGVVSGARTARAQEVPGDTSTAAESALSIPLNPAAALPPELLGRPVTRLEVVTAGGRWQASEQLRRTQLGQPLSAAYARAVLQEILATGRYAEASASALAYGSGALLRVTVLPRRIVTELRVSGGGLEPALVQEAAAVSPGDDITVPTLSAIEQRVRELYRTHGYPSAAVNTEAIDTDEPLHVVLNIAIQPGDAQSIAERQFEVHPRLSSELSRLVEQYAVETGDRLDEEQLQHADLELAARLRGEGYHDAGVEHRTQWSSSADGFVLVVAVWAGPKMRVRFDGNESFDADELAHELDLPEDADHTPGALTERMRDFYVKRGFLDAQIEFERRDASDGSVVEFWFHIRENPRVVVQARHFPCLTGARSASDVAAEIDSFSSESLPGPGLIGPVDSNQLDAQISPSHGSRVAPLTLDPWTTYDPSVYDKALEHLQALYRSEGYLSARVGPVLVSRRACAPNSPAQHCWPVGVRQAPAVNCARDPSSSEPEPPAPAALTCVPDLKRGLRCEPSVDLSIPIVLGPRAELWDIGFEGNKALVESDLHEASGLALGQPVSQLALEEARRRIVERYAEEGYAFAGVEADIELSPDRTRARAKFTISEREPVVLRDIVVRGAQFTNPDLILSRAALARGQLYRRSLVRATEERLATLGVFTSVTVDLEDPEVPARQKVAVIRVQERLPQYLDVRPGFSTGEGLRIAFEYGHRNLAARAIQFVLRVQLGYLPPALILEPSVRREFQDVLDRESLLYLLERRNSATVEFPDVGLGPLYRLSVEGLDARDITREFAIEKHAAIATLTYRPERSISFLFGAGVEFNEADLFEVQTLQDYLEDHAEDTNLIRLLNIPDGLTLAISQRLGFTWDRRDNAVAATRGTLLSLNLEHVNAFPLESSRAVGEAATSTYKGHFLQYSGRVAGYLRLTERGLALATSLRVGFNQQLVRGSTTYPDRLFFLGGVDSLRGFPIWSLVPEDLYELQQRERNDELRQRALPIRGGDLMLNPRAELRIPVLGIWQTAVFVDTGNLWARANQVFDTFHLRYSAGAGVRVSTPVGPLALDYGVNLDRRPHEGFGAFHFSIGLF